jgi:hypothetical protein
LCDGLAYILVAKQIKPIKGEKEALGVATSAYTSLKAEMPNGNVLCAGVRANYPLTNVCLRQAAARAPWRS